ncbi:MAG: YlmH/Sll1252 family protein [Defluviitaleaceae bacterium]|nr:YlmH/Sll1252 family protein [Defluviitaleaceae bacterium]
MDDVLIARMNDLAHRAVKTGSAASKFLTPAEAQRVAQDFARRKDVTLTLDGAYSGAERSCAIFTNPDWGEYNRDELFAVLKIAKRPQDSLGHRDVLGALMGLGIKREAIGDIIIHEEFAGLICLSEMAVYISENLTKAGRVGITLSEISLDALPACEEALAIKTDTVASMRLDAIVSSAFGMSRAKAAELINAGRVNLNHQICTKTDKDVAETAIISIRGMGRAKLLEIAGVSKKGRNFIKIGIYSR